MNGKHSSNLNHGQRNTGNGLESRPDVTQNQTPDFIVENHGSIFLLRPQNENAIGWVDEHIGADNGYQPQYPTVLVEHRYISDIVGGIRNDGLAVS
jgi:hypothetical protein